MNRRHLLKLLFAAPLVALVPRAKSVPPTPQVEDQHSLGPASGNYFWRFRNYTTGSTAYFFSMHPFPPAFNGNIPSECYQGSWDVVTGPIGSYYYLNNNLPNPQWIWSQQFQCWSQPWVLTT